MGAGIEIPLHDAIVLDLGCSCADRLLQKHPSSIFFIGEQLVDGLTVPLRFVCQGQDTPLLKTDCNSSEAVTGIVSFKDSDHYYRLIRIRQIFVMLIWCQGKIDKLLSKLVDFCG